MVKDSNWQRNIWPWRAGQHEGLVVLWPSCHWL